MLPKLNLVIIYITLGRNKKKNREQNEINDRIANGKMQERDNRNALMKEKLSVMHQVEERNHIILQRQEIDLINTNKNTHYERKLHRIESHIRELHELMKSEIFQIYNIEEKKDFVEELRQYQRQRNTLEIPTLNEYPTRNVTDFRTPSPTTMSLQSSKYYSSYDKMSSKDMHQAVFIKFCELLL